MKEKEQEIFKSKGWQAVNKIGILNENYHTLILNYQELINEIVRIQTSKEPMALLFNNLNLNRFIFNFLTSTSALVDSCRNTMKYYENTEIYKNYQTNIINNFANNKTVVFIKDLRNYQMHFRVEFPCLSDDGLVSYEIYKLKEYNKWTKLSQELINESGLFMELKPLFEQYFKMLEDYSIFMAMADRIGYDATGREDSVNDLLDTIYPEYLKFKADRNNYEGC